MELLLCMFGGGVGMRKVGRIVIVVGLVLMLSLVLASSPAQAGSGIGVGPSRIMFGDAAAGGEYQELIHVFNPGDEDATYSLSVTGYAGSWISFWPRYGTQTPVEKVTVRAGGEEAVLVKVNIPQDATIGEHRATIVVSAVPGEAVGGQQTVSLAAQASVIIDLVEGEPPPEGASPGEGTAMVGDEGSSPGPGQTTVVPQSGGSAMGMTVGIAAGAMLLGVGIAALLFRRGRRRSQP